LTNVEFVIRRLSARSKSTVKIQNNSIYKRR